MRAVRLSSRLLPLILGLAVVGCARPDDGLSSSSSSSAASGRSRKSAHRAWSPDRPGARTLAAGEVAELGFDEQPDYIDEDVLILTFDDGPDSASTEKVLDVLEDKGVKASFFINTENWGSVRDQQNLQDLIKRMVNEGHELANHTVHHLSLPSLDEATIETEISGVEDMVTTIMGGDAPRLTLLRAPFGEPFQEPRTGFSKVAPIVAEHAVHIGWNFDTFDYNCPTGDAQCVINNFKNGVKTPGEGAYGIILMHSVQTQTAAALPAIIDYARDAGFRFGLVEDVVCDVFGRSSARVVDGEGPGCAEGPEPGEDAGPSADAGGGDDDDDVDAGGDDDERPDAGGNQEDDDDDDDDDGGSMTGGCGCQTSGMGAGGSLLIAGVLFLAIRRRR